MLDPRHDLPASDQRRTPYDLDPEPDTDHRMEAMAPREDEGQPSEATDGVSRNTMNGDRRASTNNAKDEPKEQKKPSTLAAIVAKLGLDAPTLITMFK